MSVIMKRVFIIVLDSLGIGEMPDAADFNDKDCNTLKRISKSNGFNPKNLISMGIGNIEGVDYLPAAKNPKAAYGRMAEASKGKDTTTGHWEIGGIISNTPMPTYPNGFPPEIINEFERKIGTEVLCNKPYSGTKVILDYGEEHLKTGKPIVYTSADSVFQIAAHEKKIPLEKLYEFCQIARGILKGKNSVGRVIARPFTGEAPNFVRTASRRDFSLTPPEETMLDALLNNKKSVIAVGKISDIFAGKGIGEKLVSHSNKEGMTITRSVLDRNFEGLCFTNLVDFDMLYGHRQDINGYADAVMNFDDFLPEFTENMSEEDMLIITADHGCDPGDNHTDHTREYVPLIVFKKDIRPVNLGTRSTFADVGATVCEYLDTPFKGAGKSFLKEIFG